MATEQSQVGAPNVQETLNNLGQNKRMVMLGGAVIAVVITLIIIMMVWTRGASLGNQIELVKGIDQGRAFEIISKLKDHDIKSKITSSDIPGKVIVQVFEKQFDEAAIILSRSDLLQEEGFNLFDKTDWAASDYDKKIKKTRAINGDLSRIVSRMTGVKWATVRISIPEQQLFQQYDSPTRATVQVESEDDGKISKSQVKSVINLLIGYVPELSRENISIVDTDGNTYSTVEGDTVATGELMEETEKVNKTIQRRIEEYLEPLLGKSNFIVRVSSEISREKVEQSATTFTEGVIGQEQIGDERLGGASGSVAAIGPKAPGVDSSMGYARSNRLTQNYPSFKQENKSTLPGQITKVSVAVAINRGVPPSVSVKQLQEGVAAIASPSAIPSDIKITIAEFVKGGSAVARSKSKPVSIPGTAEVGGVMNAVGSFFSRATDVFNNFPVWGKVLAGIVGLVIFLNVLGGIFRPGVAPPQQSTISQINQSRQKQQTSAPMQIAEQAQQEAVAELTQQQMAAPQERPDISGVLSGLQEAVVEKPEFVASKLQLWVEEGAST